MVVIGGRGLGFLPQKFTLLRCDAIKSTRRWRVAQSRYLTRY
jgi:hypothetical protein